VPHSYVAVLVVGAFCHHDQCNTFLLLPPLATYCKHPCSTNMSECHNHWVLSREGLRIMDSGHGGGQLRANRALWDPRRKGLQLLSDRIHWQRWPTSFAFQISQFWNERSKLLAAFYTIFQRQPVSSYTTKLSALHQTLYRKFLNLISSTPKFLYMNSLKELVPFSNLLL
jgi:hypothetical protein